MTKQQQIALGGVGLIVAIILGISIYSQSHTLKTPTPAPTTNASSTYTMEKIAEHKDASSCWTTIDGNVYDLTAWISQHPGGKDAILFICGKDGADAFHGQHGMDQREADILATFKIGTLAK